jgi:hypothetical protein
MKNDRHWMFSMMGYLILFWDKSFNIDTKKIKKGHRLLSKSFKALSSFYSALFRGKWTKLFFLAFLKITSAQITNECESFIAHLKRVFTRIFGLYVIENQAKIILNVVKAFFLFY